MIVSLMLRDANAIERVHRRTVGSHLLDFSLRERIGGISLHIGQQVLKAVRLKVSKIDQDASRSVRKIVVLSRWMVNAVAPATGRSAFEAAQLRNQLRVRRESSRDQN